MRQILVGSVFVVAAQAMAATAFASTADGDSGALARVRSQVLLLSGNGPYDATEWRFRIDAGRGAGSLATIPVPSHWQQHGFGTHAYGQNDSAPREIGTYQREFQVPNEWQGRRIDLVFGGAMTDTTVLIDGQQVGPTHQGGFTEFRYDVTAFVTAGQTHALEVRVASESSNPSVNAAERRADYWIFGGLYRSVWLEAKPEQHIRAVRVDAQASGDLRVWVDCAANERLQVEAHVLTHPSTPRLPPTSIGAAIGECSDQHRSALLETKVHGVRPWSAEEPFLYSLRVTLREVMAWQPEDSRSSTNTPLHTVEKTIGFRTVEVRPDGFFVNGARTILKGVNRHSFWPTTGRALDPERNRNDVRLLRSLNFNAVRTAHSPPDRAFLDACDELGLYVMEELPGWHDAYDTRVGRRILEEMIERDQHHPSIVLWSNGNEGGWNPGLDREFRRLDPQLRPVLHPWQTFGNFDTTHYPDWQRLQEMLALSSLDQRLARARFGQLPLILPTEILHALYDGGGGAGLESYWNALSSHPRFAGLFLWSLFDEGLVTSSAVTGDAATREGSIDDPSGPVDTFSNHAADGILDAWRREEASAEVVRQIFSPVTIENWQLVAADAEPIGVSLQLRNKFDHLPLDRIRVDYEWLRLPAALEEPLIDLLATGSKSLPETPPGDLASVRLPIPDSPAGSVPGTRDTPQVLRVRLQRVDRDHEGPFHEAVLPLAPGLVRVPESTGATPTVDLVLAESSLESLAVGGVDSGLRGGSALLGGALVSPPVAAARPLGSDRPDTQRWRLEGEMTISWTRRPDGWVRVHAMQPFLGSDDDESLTGLTFDFDFCAATMTWLGLGPHRVWGNRRRGRFGVWTKSLASLCDETASTASTLDPTAGLYEAQWLRIHTPQGILTLVPSARELIGIGRARFPDDAREARASMVGGLSVYSDPPTIGSKFHPGEALGPVPVRPRHLGLWLHFQPASGLLEAPETGTDLPEGG